jgi:hypothetical protein
MIQSPAGVVREEVMMSPSGSLELTRDSRLTVNQRLSHAAPVERGAVAVTMSARSVEFKNTGGRDHCQE